MVSSRMLHVAGSSRGSRASPSDRGHDSWESRSGGRERSAERGSERGSDSKTSERGNDRSTDRSTDRATDRYGNERQRAGETARDTARDSSYDRRNGQNERERRDNRDRGETHFRPVAVY